MSIKFKMPTVTAKASLKFKHPVDAYHLEHYIRESLGYHAAILSIDVKYAVLDREQSDALYDLCRRLWRGRFRTGDSAPSPGVSEADAARAQRDR